MILDQLIEIMKEKNIKQADVCRKAGVQTSAMSRWYNHQRIPSINSVQKIANALGYDLVLVKKFKLARAISKDHSKHEIENAKFCAMLEMKYYIGKHFDEMFEMKIIETDKDFDIVEFRRNYG